MFSIAILAIYFISRRHFVQPNFMHTLRAILEFTMAHNYVRASKWLIENFWILRLTDDLILKSGNIEMLEWSLRQRNWVNYDCIKIAHKMNNPEVFDVVCRYYQGNVPCIITAINRGQHLMARWFYLNDPDGEFAYLNSVNYNII